MRQLWLAGFVLLGSACSEPEAAVIAGDTIPTAKNITIYSAGGSVVSGSIDSSNLGGRRLRLPAAVAAIHFSQGDQALKWFTIESKDTKEPKKDGYKLIGLPPLEAGQLDFNYALPDITWTLSLKAEIADAKSVNLQLLAMINMNATEKYEKCDVTLVLNNAVSVEKLSGFTFNLSSFDLYPHRNVTYNLGSKLTDYSFIREWNAGVGKDEVRVLLQVKNPFSVDLNQISSTVEANKIIVEAGTIGNQSRQGEIVQLPAGIDDTITTFRAFKITEATDKRLLPFNHKITYTITNHSTQAKTLRLVTPRTMGNEHRSVYHYTVPPDATPENTLVWMIKLEPGATRTLEYDYDADVKDVEGENGFEQGG